LRRVLQRRAQGVGGLDQLLQLLVGTRTRRRRSRNMSPAPITRACSPSIGAGRVSAGAAI